MSRRKNQWQKHKDFSYENLEKWAALGLTVKQMGALLDVSHDTFERDVAQDPKLIACIERGRSKAIISVSKSAYAMAESGQNPAMTMFWLKCRARWTEKSEVDHTSSDGSVKFVFVDGDGKKD